MNRAWSRLATAIPAGDSPAGGAPAGALPAIRREPAEGCGPEFKREFLGEINRETAAAHRGVPRMYYSKIPDNEDKKGNPTEPLASGTQLEVGQTAGYGGLWRAVCFKPATQPRQILWVLGEYIANLDAKRKKDEEKKKDPPKAPRKALGIAEAFVILKRAETARRHSGEHYQPSEAEREELAAATEVLVKTGKYLVDQGTFVVSFVSAPGKKIEIDTIEDFILFVESVERQYLGAKPEEVVSEIRQLWYSDVNWELLVASEGIKEAGAHIDIETEPNPVASKFNMKTLAPSTGSKQLETRMGRVDIGHVMAGIDAALSGFPKAYPEAHLKARNNDSDETKLKYETLKKASGGDSRDFTTWAGDLGQAYGEYMATRYVKGESAKLADFMTKKSPDYALRGDIHGYIAVQVWKKVPAEASPTGSTLKISNILRNLYLVDKSKGGGGPLEEHVSAVAGKSGADLRSFVRERALAFARPWFAKEAGKHRGFSGSEGWTKKGILENTLAEFDRLHEKNDIDADPADRIVTIVDQFLGMLKRDLK